MTYGPPAPPRYQSAMRCESPGSIESAFRATRLRCSVVAGETRWDGTTRVLGPSAVQAILGGWPVSGGAAIREDQVVALPVTSETGVRLESPARIAWCEPEGTEPERLLVSLELASGTGAAADAWRRLLESVRPVVLVVDEDAAHVASVRLALEPCYRVLSCTSGAEALASMEREEVSVLLT